jgi:mannosyltransferase
MEQMPGRPAPASELRAGAHAAAGQCAAGRGALGRLALDGVAPLLLLLVVAAALRFLLLGSRELFRDEAASWMLARSAWSEIIPRSAAEPFAPVFAFALKAWMTILGDSQAALRAPSAIAGVALVGVTWAWARAAISRPAAVIAAGLVALSPLAIGNAREARMYAFEALFITVAWWLIWRLLTDRRPLGRRRLAIVLAALAVAAELWTLPTGIAAFTLQAGIVGVLLVRAPHAGSRAAALALLGGLIAFGPWVPRMVDVANGAQPFWTPVPGLGDLSEAFVMGFAGGEPSPAWVAVAPLAALAAVGSWALFRRRGAAAAADRLATALAISGGAALILLWWLVSQWRSAYDERYLGAAIPPLAMAIAVGWQSLASRFGSSPAGVRGVRIAGAVLVILLVSGTVAFEAGWVNGTRLQPAAAATLLLSQRARAGDVVLVADARSYLPVAYLVERDAEPIPLAAPVRYWRSSDEPAFRGGDLVATDATVASDTRLDVGHLPGLSPTGSIWLVAVADPPAELLAFTPMAEEQVIEVERLTVADYGASGLVLRLRPAT